MYITFIKISDQEIDSLYIVYVELVSTGIFSLPWKQMASN